MRACSRSRGKPRFHHEMYCLRLQDVIHDLKDGSHDHHISERLHNNHIPLLRPGIEMKKGERGKKGLISHRISCELPVAQFPLFLKFLSIDYGEYQ